MFKFKRKIKIPNAIFNYNLSKSAFRVYVYLLNAFSGYDYVGQVKFSKIAEVCHMSVNTAQAAIKELTLSGIVSKKHTYNWADGKAMYNSNKYTVSPLSGKYTLIDNAIVKNIEDNAAFMIYCAISSYANAHRMSFPSYSQLEAITGLSRSTVINKVKLLSDNMVIAKSLYVRKAGMFGHNNYISLTSKLRAMLCRYISIAFINIKKAANKVITAFSFSLFIDTLEPVDLNACIQVLHNSLTHTKLNCGLNCTELSPIERSDVLLI